MNNFGRHFDGFPLPPTDYGYWFDFMSEHEIGHASNSTVGLFTAISSGTNAIIDTPAGGWLRIANATTTEDSGGNWQVSAANIALAASGGKTITFMSRHTISDVDACDFQAGLSVLDASWFASAPTDGFYFSLADGAATLDFTVRAASATVLSKTAVATVTDATAFDLCIRLTPSGTTGIVSRIEAWVGAGTRGVTPTLVVDEQVNTVAPLATIMMTSGLAWQSGAAAAQTCDTDFLGVRVIR